MKSSLALSLLFFCEFPLPSLPRVATNVFLRCVELRVLVVRGLGKSERMSIIWKWWLGNRGSHLSFLFFLSWEEVQGFVQCAMAGIVVVVCALS